MKKIYNNKIQEARGGPKEKVVQLTILVPFTETMFQKIWNYRRIDNPIIKNGVTELILELQAHKAKINGVSKRLQCCYGDLFMSEK